MRAGVTFRYGLVIDTPACTHSHALAAACPSCDLILCAPQEGDGPFEDREPIYSRDAYREHSSARVRKVAMQDVPSLEPHTLDFTLVRQLRIDTSVDQQAGASSGFVLYLYQRASVSFLPFALRLYLFLSLRSSPSPRRRLLACLLASPRHLPQARGTLPGIRA